MKKRMLGIISIITGVIGMFLVLAKINQKVSIEQSRKTEKFRTYYNVLNQWLIITQQGKKIDTLFTDKGYQKIAIYGAGEIGNRLLKELENSLVTVKYVMDSATPTMDEDMNIVQENEIETVDAIIVTAMFAYEDIEESLRNRWKCPIISFEEIIFSV